MSLTFSAARSYGGAFLVDEKKIAALVELCARLSERPVEIQLGFFNNMQVSGDNLVTILGDALVRLYPAQDLTVRSVLSGIEVRVRASGAAGAEVMYIVRSENTDVGRDLVAKLEAEISDMRQWYRFVYPNSALVRFGGFFVTTLSFGFGAVILWSQFLPIKGWEGVVTVVWALGGIAVALTADKVRRFLFPTVVFDFGKGTIVGRQRATFRMILFTGVVLAAVMKVVLAKLLG